MTFCWVLKCVHMKSPHNLMGFSLFFTAMLLPLLPPLTNIEWVNKCKINIKKSTQYRRTMQRPRECEVRASRREKKQIHSFKSIWVLMKWDEICQHFKMSFRILNVWTCKESRNFLSGNFAIQIAQRMQIKKLCDYSMSSCIEIIHICV